MNWRYSLLTTAEPATGSTFESLRPAQGPAGNGSATASTNRAKRMYDAVLATTGLILLSPLFLLIALMVKVADGGPVFYRQRRIGQHGIPFFIPKFRSMVPEADRLG